MLDIEKFVDGLHDYISKAVAPLHDRIKALESIQIERGEKGEQGEAGKDADPITPDQLHAALMEIIKADPGMVAEVVKEYMAANPPQNGKDGRDGIDGKDGAPAAEEQIQKAVASHLALNPPAPGRDGRDGMNAIGEKGADGKDGTNGRDGIDGFGLADFDAALDDDGRTVLLSFGDGERAVHKLLKFPVVIDRDVFKDGDEYAKGDGVTFAGSFWIAKKDAPEGKPGMSGDWRLSVKRGRDGKDGRDGIDKTATVKLP